MHLTEMLSFRPVPAAGLFLSLTRRCPLSCAHCSTNSTLQSEEQADEHLLRFMRTITPATRPELLLLTGGEPLLRPRLVRQLTDMAHALGMRVCLISGMFFARQPRVPKLIDRAIAGVDLLTASLDIFHEQQVARADVLRVLRGYLDRGQDIYIQVTGLNARDPYIQEVIESIRATFDDRVPVLVTYVGPVGRGKEWFAKHHPEMLAAGVAGGLGAGAGLHGSTPMPCAMAAWPVVAFDGHIVACCNQAVVDGPTAPHLRLGHIATDDWPQVRERYLRSTMLRAIRVFGPQHVNAEFGSGTLSCDGYCATCGRLSDDPEITRRLQPTMARPGMSVVEQHVQTLMGGQFAAFYGVREYAHLVELGAPHERGSACTG